MELDVHVSNFSVFFVFHSCTIYLYAILNVLYNGFWGRWGAGSERGEGGNTEPFTLRLGLNCAKEAMTI